MEAAADEVVKVVAVLTVVVDAGGKDAVALTATAAGASVAAAASAGGAVPSGSGSSSPGRCWGQAGARWWGRRPAPGPGPAAREALEAEQLRHNMGCAPLPHRSDPTTGTSAFSQNTLHQRK